LVSPETAVVHQTPLVGPGPQIESIRAQEVTGRILSLICSVFVSFLMIIGAAGAFWIWLLDRPRPTYLWLTLALVLAAAPTAVLTTSLFSYTFTQGIASLLIETSHTLTLACWVFFWRRWFQLPRNFRFDLLLAALVAGDLLAMLFSVVAVHASAPAILTSMKMRAACDLGLGVMLFVPALQGARRDRTGALLALPPIILLAISGLSGELINWFGIRTSFFPFGVQISVTEVAQLLLLLVVGALVLRRFVSSQISQRLERRAVELEMEQARELQQHVLIPEPVVSPMFTVETAYHPARQVGGDFFQVIPQADGSLVIVVGDVSGKGMGAAMLVAVLVGAIRTRADMSPDPGAMLHTLNERLLGRAG
jgi:hypothetical protein